MSDTETEQLTKHQRYYRRHKEARKKLVAENRKAHADETVYCNCCDITVKHACHSAHLRSKKHIENHRMAYPDENPKLLPRGAIKDKQCMIKFLKKRDRKIPAAFIEEAKAIPFTDSIARYLSAKPVKYMVTAIHDLWITNNRLERVKSLLTDPQWNYKRQSDLYKHLFPTQEQINDLEHQLWHTLDSDGNIDIGPLYELETDITFASHWAIGLTGHKKEWTRFEYIIPRGESTETLEDEED